MYTAPKNRWGLLYWCTLYNLLKTKWRNNGQWKSKHQLINPKQSSQWHQCLHHSETTYTTRRHPGSTAPASGLTTCETWLGCIYRFMLPVVTLATQNSNTKLDRNQSRSIGREQLSVATPCKTILFWWVVLLLPLHCTCHFYFNQMVHVKLIHNHLCFLNGKIDINLTGPVLHCGEFFGAVYNISKLVHCI